MCDVEMSFSVTDILLDLEHLTKPVIDPKQDQEYIVKCLFFSGKKNYDIATCTCLHLILSPYSSYQCKA